MIDWNGDEKDKEGGRSSSISILAEENNIKHNDFPS
jgi:hypothetical protein